MCVDLLGSRGPRVDDVDAEVHAELAGLNCREHLAHVVQRDPAPREFENEYEKVGNLRADDATVYVH